MDYFKEFKVKRIKELQSSIKHTIALLGWSLKDFVGKYMIETHDFVEEEDINQFYETVRKQIERDTTKVELLVKYHSFLFATDEYKNLRTISENTSTPNSYPLMNIPEINYELTPDRTQKEEELLLMGISYAEKMGSCWDFTIVKNDLVTKDSLSKYEEPSYIIIYQCDFGFNGGSGCYGVGVIEIWAKNCGFGGFYIADKKCEIDCGGARFSHVVGMKKGELIIVAKDFDSLDPQSKQTLSAKIVLSRHHSGSKVWQMKSKEYIHKNLELDLSKLESGYT